MHPHKPSPSFAWVFSIGVFATTLLLAACTTDPEDDGDGDINVYGHLINEWEISAATITPVAQIPAVPGVPSLPVTTGNLLLIVDDCEKEAVISFRADGVYLNTEGDGCAPADTGTWVRNDSTLYINVTSRALPPDTLTIVELSATVLKLRARNDELPDNVMRTINWTLVPR